MTRRSVPEWIGKTSDTPVPPRVKLRVFEHYNGVCYLSKRKIKPGEAWDMDHIIAICNGGQNRENNLAPALTKSHRTKTATDLAEKAKIDKIRKRHLGITKPKSNLSNSKFKKLINGTVVNRTTDEIV